MPARIFLIVRKDNFLVGALRFDEDNFVAGCTPVAADILIGFRKEVVEELCDKQGWELITPKDYKK